MKKMKVLVFLSVLMITSASFAAVTSSKIKGKWSLVGVSPTLKAKADPWKYTPMSWEFINSKDMKYIYGVTESKLTYTIKENDIKMTIAGNTTKYTVKKVGSKSMVWHNPAMNNYYHLKKTK